MGFSGCCGSLEFPRDMRGKKMTVSVYSNCEQVELFLNGESLGKQENTADKKNTLVWEVPYAHGILKVVSYNKGGRSGHCNVGKCR